jgi:hypothetical protein
VETVDGVDIYENPYPLSIGYAVSDNVKDWDSSGVDRLPMQNALAYDMTGISGLFTVIYPEITGSSYDCDVSIDRDIITFTPGKSGAVTHTESFTVDTPGDYYVNCRGNYITKIRFSINGEEYAYDRYQIQIFHLGNLNIGDVVTVDYEYDSAPSGTTTAALSVALFDAVNYEHIYRALSSHMLENVSYADGYVRGDIDMPAASTLLTSIPYDEGWTVIVDGVESEYYEALGGFIGVDMGAYISLISLLVMIGFTTVMHLYRKRE